MVGGIVGVVGVNNLGVCGVVLVVMLKGFNLILCLVLGNQQSNIEYVWWDGVELVDVQVFNNSWGVGLGNLNLLLVYSENMICLYEQVLLGMCGGCGGIYVKLVGNNFNNVLISQIQDVCIIDIKNCNIGCVLVGCDLCNNLFNVIMVGVVCVDGVCLLYFFIGLVLWVLVFGGEYGLQVQYVFGLVVCVYDLVIVIIDVIGCVQGSNKNINCQNILDSNLLVIDSICNYIVKMNGILVLVLMVLGVVVLVLEVNLNLFYCDVKYILVIIVICNYLNQLVVMLVDGCMLVLGWMVNVVGCVYSNWYGFGVVNVVCVVQVVENFQLFGVLVDSGWCNIMCIVVIGNILVVVVCLIFQLVNGVCNIESVQLGFWVNYCNMCQLQFVLVLFSGICSVVQLVFIVIGLGMGGVQSNFISWDLLFSNVFLDENVMGIWMLEVIDMGQVVIVVLCGNFEFFKICVLGY